MDVRTITGNYPEQKKEFPFLKDNEVRNVLGYPFLIYTKKGSGQETGCGPFHFGRRRITAGGVERVFVFWTYGI